MTGRQGHNIGRPGKPGWQPVITGQTPPTAAPGAQTAHSEEVNPTEPPDRTSPRPGRGQMIRLKGASKRYDGLTLRDSAPPDWSVGAHRHALNSAGVRMVSIDVETTSLTPEDGSVTEVGWFDINDGIGGAFVPPHDPSKLDDKAREVSRYDDRIAGQPTDAEQVRHLHRILGGDGSRVVIVGSNPKFDVAHLNILFESHGLSPDPWSRRHVDVGAAAYWLTERPIGSTTGLAAAAQEFGIDNDQHHDAYNDAVVAAQVWHSMETKRSRQFEPPF